MKYFIDTHDKNKGSFPAQELTEEQFFAQFDALDKAATAYGAFGHAAHVNLPEGKAFCFMSGPDEDAIRKAHAAIKPRAEELKFRQIPWLLDLNQGIQVAKAEQRPLLIWTGQQSHPLERC